jgi:hypothetical protein
MAVMTKTNGTAKKETATVKKEVQKKLAQEATGKTVTVQPVEKPTIQQAEKPVINLDDRMQKFEKLKGLAGQRERLSETLSELTKFKYNQSDSASFYIKDSVGLEFKTTNSNLIHLVTNHLKTTLELRKAEIETQLIAFEL